MWRPRDHERFIGSYDPEHEMPNPDRGPGDRWQSDAYRHNARDTRFAYRWNPDRFEERFEGRRGFDRPFDRDYGRDYDRDYDRGFRSGFDRQRGYGPDRGWDRDRVFGFGPRREGPYYE